MFTTNHKDRLDPALLRPGRMDMHIHMSYCTPCGFEILASNYLRIQSHCLFNEIQGLIEKVEVTPAEVAEELMKNEDPDLSLAGLVASLHQKQQMKCVEESKFEGGGAVNEEDKRSPKMEEVGKKKKSRKARRGKGNR